MMGFLICEGSSVQILTSLKMTEMEVISKMLIQDLGSDPVKKTEK
jgi:hypothetical protein